jgi:hypothetical protein
LCEEDAKKRRAILRKNTIQPAPAAEAERSRRKNSQGRQRRNKHGTQAAEMVGRRKGGGRTVREDGEAWWTSSIDFYSRYNPNTISTQNNDDCERKERGSADTTFEHRRV